MTIGAEFSYFPYDLQRGSRWAHQSQFSVPFVVAKYSRSDLKHEVKSAGINDDCTWAVIILDGMIKKCFFSPLGARACLPRGVRAGNAMRSRKEGRPSIMEARMINYCGRAIEINGRGWPLHKERRALSLARVLFILRLLCPCAVTVFAHRFSVARKWKKWSNPAD
jgi:hypothetical protein